MALETVSMIRGCCPSCGKTLRIKAALAGRRIRCPNVDCQELLTASVDGRITALELAKPNDSFSSDVIIPRTVGREPGESILLFLAGLGLIGLGALITYLSYQMASDGGQYVVTVGLFLAGGGMVLRSLFSK